MIRKRQKEGRDKRRRAGKAEERRGRLGVWTWRNIERGRPHPGCGGPLPTPEIHISVFYVHNNFLVIQQTFTDHLLCTRHYSKPGDTALNGTDRFQPCGSCDSHWRRG